MPGPVSAVTSAHQSAVMPVLRQVCSEGSRSIRKWENLQITVGNQELAEDAGIVEIDARIAQIEWMRWRK